MDETAGGKPENKIDYSDQLQGLQLELAKTLVEQGFSKELVNCLYKEVLANVTCEYVPGRELTHFFDIGTIEGGIPNGEYHIVFGGLTLESRAQRLKGFVPPQSEQELAFYWLASHELGHALQSAYSLFYRDDINEGLLKGLPSFPRPAQDYLRENPREARHTGTQEAEIIENERQAEGIARLMLKKRLTEIGYSIEETEQALNSIYARRKQELGLLDPSTLDIHKDSYAVHEFGYTEPLSSEELKQRFNRVTRQ